MRGESGHLTKFWSDKVIDFSNDTVNLFGENHFDSKQKEIQYLHMLTHDEYMQKLIRK